MERVEALRQKMREGKLVKGFFLTMSDPAVSEIAGYAGYDYVWIDAEHAPLGRQEILNHVRAAQGSGCAGVCLSGFRRSEGTGTHPGEPLRPCG